MSRAKLFPDPSRGKAPGGNFNQTPSILSCSDTQPQRQESFSQNYKAFQDVSSGSQMCPNTPIGPRPKNGPHFLFFHLAQRVGEAQDRFQAVFRGGLSKAKAPGRQPCSSSAEKRGRVVVVSIFFVTVIYQELGCISYCESVRTKQEVYQALLKAPSKLSKPAINLATFGSRKKGPSVSALTWVMSPSR